MGPLNRPPTGAPEQGAPSGLGDVASGLAGLIGNRPAQAPNDPPATAPADPESAPSGLTRPTDQSRAPQADDAPADDSAPSGLPRRPDAG